MSIRKYKKGKKVIEKKSLGRKTRKYRKSKRGGNGNKSKGDHKKYLKQKKIKCHTSI